MDKINKEKALQKVQSPSQEQDNLSSTTRIGLASGGALLAAAGIRKFKQTGWPLVAVGGAITLIGAIGKNPLALFKKRNKNQLRVNTSIMINKNREEVYDFWRNLENLPSFMDHIKEVKQISDTKSHWVANIQNADIEWDAEITQDEPGRLIAWRSLPGSEVQTEGRVEFKTRNKQTELTVSMQYEDKDGKIAKGFAALYHPIFKDQVKSELKRCKVKLETGLKPKIEAEPQTH